MDPALLSAGVPKGDFGLQGIRERARFVGGNLTAWSEVDSGTELELRVPASAERGSW